MDELKAQKEKQKIPEVFGRKEEKLIFIAEIVPQKDISEMIPTIEYIFN